MSATPLLSGGLCGRQRSFASRAAGSSRRAHRARAVALLAGVMGLASLLSPDDAWAQQASKPPKAQLWIDVATGTIAGMPDMDMPAGLGGMLGGMMGGGVGAAGGGSYGMARNPGMLPGRYLDIAFYSSLRPGAEVEQRIPSGMRMGEALPLVPPRPQPGARAPVDEREPSEPAEIERPKGRILIYWGCGAQVRSGQPRVIDLARGSPMDFAAAFAGRYAPDRGARVGPQHALFPNEKTRVRLTRDSSMVGEHQLRGDGVPASLRFTLAAAHDVMPGIALQTSGRPDGVISASWQPLPQARAYYLHALGKVGDDMVFWSSADSGDTGMGLFDFLPNGTLERWVRERVLLAPDVTRCEIPRGIFAGAATSSQRGRGGDESGGMLRMIAYGGEANFAHPPRPADPNAVWEPEWAVRLRLKSTTMAMLGQEHDARQARERDADEEQQRQAEQKQKPKPDDALPSPATILRGILGR